MLKNSGLRGVGKGTTFSRAVNALKWIRASAPEVSSSPVPRLFQHSVQRRRDYREINRGF
jgi:hypothetical protein